MQSDIQSAPAKGNPSSHVDDIHNEKPHDEHEHASGALKNEVDIINVTQKSPYLEKNFIGTYLAICLGSLSAYGGFVMPATSLALINEDIGPSPNIIWVALAWTLAVTIGYTLVGRLSDLFGRRWFFTGAALLATIGCVVGGTAENVNQLIGANVLIGLAASAQLSFNYQLGELVPVKHRFFANAGVFLFGVPFSSFGPLISREFIVHTHRGWRWDYYLSIITDGLSCICYLIFYHPPDFDGLHGHRRSRWQEIKDLDVGGIFLYTAGLLLFLMGLSWGGSLYPWDSAHVIATIVVGFVLCVAFVLYEIYMPLRRPLLPMHLFKNIEYTALTVITTVGGMLYYSLNVIYPTMVAALFTSDIVKQGLLSCAIGGGVGAGQVFGAIFATPGGYIPLKLIVSCFCLTALTAGLAGATTQSTASALATLSATAIGVLESLATGLVTIVIDDQRELGAAGGAFGSIRTMGGVLATTIFSTILTNKVTDNTKSIVVPAIVKAGLPVTSVKTFLTALSTGNDAAITAVPGVTKKIIAVAVAATQKAYQRSFFVVYLASISFGGLAIIASFWTPDVESRLTHDVMRRLNITAPSEKSADKENPSQTVAGLEQA